MITFDQVSKRYGERLALDSLSWRMDEGECVVFLGHSGAGKTTLLRMITQEIQPSTGRVVVGTFQGGRLRRRQRALLRRTMGIIYEDFRLLGDRTVFENVALAVHISGHFRDEDVVPRVQFALDEVALAHKAGAYPHELSAGEKQRTAIARAIVNRPAVILADEPTGALEPHSTGEVLALLRRIHGEGAAVILVTTRRDVAAALPGRVLELEEGRLVAGDAGMSRTSDPAPRDTPSLDEPHDTPSLEEPREGAGREEASPPIPSGVPPEGLAEEDVPPLTSLLEPPAAGGPRASAAGS